MESKYASKKKINGVVKEGNTNKNKVDLPYNKYPKHQVDLVSIIMYNAEIRRFTALAIINTLKQKGTIKGKSVFVKFRWNKIAICVDGLYQEYSYKEPWFINSLVGAFSSFANSAEEIIKTFLNAESKDNNESNDSEVENEVIENVTIASNSEHNN